MELLIQQILAGIATGGIYASLALALVIIYRSTEVVNFAQGEMAMFSTYVAWSLIAAGFPYWAAFLITIALSFAGGIAIERLIIRPVENAPVLSIVVVCIALLVIFNALAGWLFTYEIRVFPSPFPDRTLFGGYLDAHDLGAILLTLAVMALVFGFFRFTRLGLAMRAAALDPESSSLVGIRVGWMLALGWGMAGAVGAVAGMMVAPSLFLDPNMMGGVLIYAFAGALLGGITSPGGAVFGGFALGVLENLVGTYLIGNELKLSVALVIIVAVLVLRPSGLFGRPSVERV